jgi:hypothetical protein
VSRWKPATDRCRCGNPIRILGKYCLSCASKKADELVSIHARQRDGACRWPGCNVRGWNRLDAHHVMRRSYYRVRFNPDNLISLCREHHRHVHRDKAIVRDLVEELFPGRWDHLLRLREHEGRVDLEAVLTTFGRKAA